MKTLIIFLISFGPYVYSRDKKPLSIDLAYMAQSNSLYRGAQTWPHPSTFIGPSFTFYNRLSIKGPHLEYSHFSRKSPWQAKMGVRYYDDDRPWIEFTDHKEDYRNKRESTVNLNILGEYRFGFKNKFSINFNVHKELKEHKGVFFETSTKIPIIKYLSLGYTLGLGDQESNQYLYGPEGKSGLAYHKLGLSYAYPRPPWKGIIITSLTGSKIIQTENQKADYVRSHDKQISAKLMLIWNIY